MTVGDRIRIRREYLGLTQEELSKRLGVKSKSSVAKIESAGDIISTKNVTKYADALECTPAHLMGWDNTEEKPSTETILKNAAMNKVLLDISSKLNDLGLSKLISYAEDLSEMPRYKR